MRTKYVTEQSLTHARDAGEPRQRAFDVRSIWRSSVVYVAQMRNLTFGLVALLWTAGCRSVGPMHALQSTIPLNAESEHLSYIGEASGKACQATVLYFIPLESDSSIYEAKRAALRDASTRYARPAVALVDVSIDVETVSYLVYTRICTWVRGKALGADPRPHAPTAHPAPREPSAGVQEAQPAQQLDTAPMPRRPFTRPQDAEASGGQAWRITSAWAL